MWLGRFYFDGPFSNLAQINDFGGLYAVLDEAGAVIDIGESGQLRTRLRSHDRIPCWQAHSNGRYWVYILYTPNKSTEFRLDIERSLRARYNPPCGVR